MPEVFYLFLFGHIIGDFYLQSSGMAERKQKEAGAVCIHALLYCSAMLVVSIPLLILNLQAGILASVIAGLAHFCIDIIKHAAVRIRKHSEDPFWLFAADQAVHIAVIAAGSYVLKGYISETGITQLFLGGLNMSYLVTVKLLIVLALMGRPANITFRKALKTAKAEDRLADAASGMKNAGAIIGTLERIIVSVMIFLGEYASVAIVLTAKSIVRYNRIKAEPKFAEYYLIGTLSSIAYAILVTMLFFQTH